MKLSNLELSSWIFFMLACDVFIDLSVSEMLIDALFDVGIL